MDEFFGPGGLFEQRLEGYEQRLSQARMAAAVYDALENQNHLIVEAGTGTGKTLAYLLPALMTGRRILVSTGTKTLQDQIFYKDIPLLETVLDRPIRAAYLKGRSNYLCRLKLTGLEAEGLFSPSEYGAFRRIVEWAGQTETGDRAEVGLSDSDSDLWSRLDASRDRCLGSKCHDFDRCFLTLMRQKALEADIVVVNHHLFFADLAIRNSDAPAILPDYSAVIFDEAHELEDVATEYFGFHVSNFRIQDLVNDTRRLLEKSDLDIAATGEIEGAIFRTQRAGDVFFGRFLMVPDGRHPMPPLEGVDWPMASLRDLGRLLGKQQDLFGQWEALSRRSREIAGDFDAFREGALENYVSWIERRGRGVFLEACPIDVSGMLDESLFSRVPSCVLTSATLTVGGSFAYFRQRIGMDEGRELALATEFDLRGQAMLYLPRKMPDYRNPLYLDRSIREIHDILKASRGRAFVLFTSYRQMLTVYEAVSADSPYPCFLQERSGGRARLIDEFRATPNAVLFATASFWQGVDVKGEALSAVIIDKLPFQVPSDPLVSARTRNIEQAGGDPFSGYQVPNAVLRLKQGLGRLIRSKTDRGILAILDNRLTTRSYGRLFMESLPDYAVTDNVSDLAEFMAEDESRSIL
ncbi:MAG TPA: ATP-dependent DNA helicase [Terriglobia bacterium]|nr:ATP-dependent DNA helicase [Terriglobia bacterium]